MTFRVTAIEPADFPMPTIEEYMALAEAWHDESEFCNANYQHPFDECGAREADIDDAIRVLVALRKDGWRLVRDVNATPRLGL